MSDSITSSAAALPRPIGRYSQSALIDLVRYSPNDRVLGLAFATLLVACLLGYTGATPSPWDKYAPATAFLAVALIGALWFVLFAFSKPSPRDWLASFVLLGVGAIAQQQLVSQALSDATLRVVYLLGPFAFAGVYGAISVWVRYCRSRARNGMLDGETMRLAALLGAMVFACLFTTYGDVILQTTTALHPATLDPLALTIDRLYGFDASRVMAGVLSMSPNAVLIVKAIYGVAPLGFLMLFGLQVRTDKPQAWNFVWTWGVITLLGILSYNLFPISGPRYWLGDEFFAPSSPLPDVGLAAVVIPPAPRNGMPSFHFGWALAMWLMSLWVGRRWVTWLFGAYACAMVVATLGLGEHYLIDLFVAVPFIGAMLALTLHNVPWTDASRRPLVYGGLGLFLCWVISMRLAAPLFAASSGPLWLLTSLSVAYGVVLYRRLASLRLRVQGREQAWGYGSAVVAAKPARSEPAIAGQASQLVPVLGMFLVSGFAGLMYEVLFSKQLAMIFGSMAQAAYTVLATYMGGMALGSWLGGRIYRRYPHGLALYLIFEACVGVYCLASPLLLTAIQAIYATVAAGSSPGAAWLVPLRLALGSTLLALPTVLMGASLPVLVAYLRDRRVAPERSVSMLYGANTLGAALGAFCAGYVVIPSLGLYRTTAVAAVLSLFVAWLALRLLKADARLNQLPASLSGLLAAVRDAARQQHSVVEVVRRTRLPAGVLPALITLAVTGAVTMVVETNYIHLLAVVAGSSAYAFSLMLATFLVGLAAGSFLVGRAGAALRDPAIAANWGLAALAVILTLGGFQWGAMSEQFASYMTYRLPREFGAHEFVRGVVCFVVMFPPAVVIGALYPLAMQWAAPDGDAEKIGAAAAVNTIGNIVGVFVGGFLLLPWLGAHAAIKVAAFLCLLVALGIALRATQANRLVPAALTIAAALFAGFTPWQLDMTRVANGANVYFAPLNYGTVIDHADSVDGGLSAVSRTPIGASGALLTLTTNGKFQGNDAKQGEMRAQLGFSVTPLLHTSARGDALVIGYGTGMSAHVLHEAGFASLDIADLSGDIVRLADKYFGSINGRVSQAPGVTTHIVDGRNLLLLQDKSYDLIGIEISSIWFSGAASLYNKEFYELVKRRLRTGGVLQQWVQLHHMRPEDLLSVIGSVRAVFPQIWIYVVGGQGIIVASTSTQPPSRENIDLIERTPGLAHMMRDVGTDVATIEGNRLLTPPEVDRMLSGYGVGLEYWVSNDDNLRLEYGTPRGNVLDGKESFNANMRVLMHKGPLNEDTGKPGG
jgi:predicted membrane-bound spermidine synthase